MNAEWSCLTCGAIGSLSDSIGHRHGGEDGPCDECGTRYPAWWVDHAIWNLVMGGPEAKGDPGGMLCPNCFLTRAEPAKSRKGAWYINLPVKPEDTVAALRTRVREAFDPGELDCPRLGFACRDALSADRWCRNCRINAALGGAE